MDDDASWTSRLLRPPSVAFTLPLISDTYLYVEIYVWLYPKSAVLAKKSSILEFPALAKSITLYCALPSLPPTLPTPSKVLCLLVFFVPCNYNSFFVNIRKL